MALSQGNQILAAEIISIKERVKAEMARRNGVGSLAQYAGADYDFTVMPVSGGNILPEHYNKIIIPLNAINDTGYTERMAGQAYPSLDDLNAFLTECENTDMTGTNTNCASSCTGVCVGSCSGSCRGSCSNACADGCSNSCMGSCSGGCTGQCVNTCKNTCSLRCEDNCYGDCTGQAR